MYDLLKHVRVVEGSAFVAAPLAGLTLAQLGADVIRFDMIGGGIDYRRMPRSEESGTSLYWTGLNKAKRSVAVNLRDPRGRALIQDLITAPGPDGGILLTNFSNVAWLAYEELAKRRSDLIKVAIQGNHDGSNAVDYTVNCAAGFPMVTGQGQSEQPVNHVLPAWDVTTGVQAAFGVLAALIDRMRSGKGKNVTLALSDMAFSVTAHLGYLAEAMVNETQRPATGNDLYGAFGRDFATADGRRIMIVAISPKQWSALCRACSIEGDVGTLERELGVDLSLEDQRFDARDRISELVAPWCAARTLSDIARCFDAEGVCWGPYQSFSQMSRIDPRVSTDNPLFQLIEQSGVGNILAPGSPLTFADLGRGDVRPAPAIGEHTDEVLLETLGLSSGDVGRLHDAGVVAGPDASS
ncbi:CoA transferase [Nitratireductor sp. XY-223]|uniref:CoA transferase n=1 Tax=Nitratireductor sp. XY-223 TaxID=2561926 RepID=UPI0010AA2FA1|nr:CoA transferase [Nitratireductor sp. XY-223]